jgi:hypothetical protein
VTGSESRSAPSSQTTERCSPRAAALGARRPSSVERFHEALLEANTLEDLPGKWQAAILKAEQNRPRLRIVERS